MSAIQSFSSSLPDQSPAAELKDQARWVTGGTEAPLEEFYADPLLHLLLQSDGLSVDDLRGEISRAQEQLAGQASAAL